MMQRQFFNDTNQPRQYYTSGNPFGGGYNVGRTQIISGGIIPDQANTYMAPRLTQYGGQDDVILPQRSGRFWSAPPPVNNTGQTMYSSTQMSPADYQLYQQYLMNAPSDVIVDRGAVSHDAMTSWSGKWRPLTQYLQSDQAQVAYSQPASGGYVTRNVDYTNPAYLGVPAGRVVQGGYQGRLQTYPI